jgi:hypothetical protein
VADAQLIVNVHGGIALIGQNSVHFIDGMLLAEVFTLDARVA